MSHTQLPPDHADRLSRARLSLDGLSVGDAFGEQFFLSADRQFFDDAEPPLPPGPWGYTDDTEMALGILDVLTELGTIDQDRLAKRFGVRFLQERSRGYGPGAFRLLTSVAEGGDWRLESKALFGGSGSFGNGTAMRIAPLGAYFADSLPRAVEEATKASEVTHRHPDGLAGGVALAVAAAFTWNNRHRATEPAFREEFFDAVLAHTPKTETRDRIEHARIIESTMSSRSAAHLLGNGSRISCQDTVPFCLWQIARYTGDYHAAIWETVRQGGDIDTTAAIVGGVVVLATGREGIPPEWLARREELK